MKRLMTLLAMAMLVMGMLAGCSSEVARQDGFDPLTAEFAEVEEAARGTVVRFYMYGGFAHVNKWVDTYVAGELKSRYDITLERVPMDAGVFVNKLLTEQDAGKQDGSIDLLWVNGENFKALKLSGALFGPYAERLPNYLAHVDKKLAANDFGFPVDGYETPYGMAQFVFEFDSARTASPPRNYADLEQWVQTNPGRFTYPQPPDFTGSAFIRQVFYAVTGGHEQYMDGFDQALFDANAPKLWAYLNGLKPYLWQEGRAYPKNSADLDTLFARGEVDLSMSYHPPHAQTLIIDGAYPDTVRTYAMTNGSIFNLHFTAIPFNAPNSAGAMVAANFLLSPEAQLSKFAPEKWGDFPAIDLATLEPSMAARFVAVDLGKATLSASDLAPLAVPEIPAEYLEALEKGWEENVLR